MTKMIKLSLAAAVAVSALTTTATAGSLEDAIKDTTISGKAMVGYNYSKNKISETNKNEIEYDLDLTLTTKVNETISATIGFQADHDVNTRDETTDTDTKGDTITLTKLYFTAKTDAATVMVGKQKVGTPFFDDERGDGIVALIPAGPVTIAAAHFTGVNSSMKVYDSGFDVVNDLVEDELGYEIPSIGMSERDVSALAVIGTAGPVNASLWYAQLTGADSLGAIEDGAKAYSVNLNAKVGPVNLDFTHSDAKLKSADTEKETLTKLIASASVAGVNLVAGYGMTNDNDLGFRVHGVDLTADDDAKANFRLDQIALDRFNDADALLLGASMAFGKTTVGANYLMATVDDVLNIGEDAKAKELDLTVKYAMSKNFSITGLYSDAEIKIDGDKIVDESRMELSLNYKF